MPALNWFAVPFIQLDLVKAVDFISRRSGKIEDKQR
jgi:hypothetical protein